MVYSVEEYGDLPSSWVLNVWLYLGRLHSYTIRVFLECRCRFRYEHLILFNMVYWRVVKYVTFSPILLITSVGSFFFIWCFPIVLVFICKHLWLNIGHLGKRRVVQPRTLSLSWMGERNLQVGIRVGFVPLGTLTEKTKTPIEQLYICPFDLSHTVYVLLL